MTENQIALYYSFKHYKLNRARKIVSVAERHWQLRSWLLIGVDSTGYQ